MGVTHWPHNPTKTTFLNPQGPKRTHISQESFGAAWGNGSCDGKRHSPKNEISIHKACPSAYTSSGCSQDCSSHLYSLTMCFLLTQSLRCWSSGEQEPQSFRKEAATAALDTHAVEVIPTIKNRDKEWTNAQWIS